MHLELHPEPPEAAAWDALLAASDAPTPFMRHAYLQALVHSGAASARTGWTPQFASLMAGDELLAACPLWIKSHSWGEFVFDQAWARAYAQHGLPYYPKGVVAVPFTPVRGSRLLARDDANRALLAGALMQAAGELGLSGLHLLFGSAADEAAVASLGWAYREQPQFHWQRAPHWRTFEDFLADLKRDKRKKIQQERRHVREAGVTVRVRVGEAIDAADWSFFDRCYARTYALRGNPPYLPEGFFQGALGPGDRWVLVLAERAGEPLGAALLAMDAAGTTVYGRHWGAVVDLPFLHFELCYYAPLAWCLEQGVQRFEGGAQGEHKMARGLLPVPTRSHHWLVDERFADAVARFAEAEQAAVAQYEADLAARTPFKGA
ncbi:GNAT family N-acetyltransferase [Inhella gelatinilytica]|uniref:N-acetyltransferase n=1 Tax=Inhella gelatinilytica TaxID=2795030 RepID=A0A931ISC4_9BURK|nr:peptidogalycan biosysnthesis protein [Inhella gelatinilytica]MBH9551785.1 N-acetyltransferase [Inhella gelatinilytica]